MKKFITMMVAFLAIVTLPAAPAMADNWDTTTNGVPDAIRTVNWGSTAAPGTRDFDGYAQWSYAKYPLNCLPNSDTSKPSIKLIWATKASDTETPYIDSNPGAARDMIRRVASTFAASGVKAITSTSIKYKDLSPRFVTWEQTISNPGMPDTIKCQPLFAREVIPDDVWGREPFATGGMWEYLKSKGYTEPNRSYFVVAAGGGLWNAGGGVAINASGDAANPDPKTNGTNRATWGQGMGGSQAAGNHAWDPYSPYYMGEILQHEITHMIGAVEWNAPHNNPSNPSHPTDCLDVMCYNTLDVEGQTWSACGGGTSFMDSEPTKRNAFREDCNRDDYWAIDNTTAAEKAWASTRWAASRSSFLWGNEANMYTGGSVASKAAVPNSGNVIVD